MQGRVKNRYSLDQRQPSRQIYNRLNPRGNGQAVGDRLFELVDAMHLDPCATSHLARVRNRGFDGVTRIDVEAAQPASAGSRENRAAWKPM